MSFTLMYDGVNVSQWPADVTHGLVYTDGHFANEAQARARFPNATFQTISAVGQAPAQWIDCEPGAVWPPVTAVALYKRWRLQGCRGIYCNQASKPAVQQAARQAGAGPEIFGADWTGVPHINPGESQTQYLSTPGFDITAIPAATSPAPAPLPPAVPAPVKEGIMFVCVTTGPASGPPQPVLQPGEHHLIYANGSRYVIETPADLGALVARLGAPVALTCSFVANIPVMP